MHVRSILGLVSISAALALSISCAGSMEDTGASEAAGSHAELVAQKRAWLKGYHDDCQICFSAFEQCERGAVSAEETSACQIALDACVRGGLEDDDTGDAGQDPAPGTTDDDPEARADAGVTDEVTDPNEPDAGNPGGDENKGELIEDIGNCLDQLRSCAGVANADKKACMGELKSCVKDAVAGAFDGVCAQELSACVKERVPADALERVRALCEDAVIP